MIMAAGGAAGGRTADDDALRTLRWNWGEAYLIGRDDERGWWATRRDRIGSLLIGTDADGLRAAIRADYALKRVPRDLAAPGDEP
jgi:hypothetical protein